MSFCPACSSYQRYLWKDICRAGSTIRHSRTLPWCYTSISNGMETRKNWESHLSLGRIHMKASRIVTIPTAQICDSTIPDVFTSMLIKDFCWSLLRRCDCWYVFQVAWSNGLSSTTLLLCPQTSNHGTLESI